MPSPIAHCSMGWLVTPTAWRALSRRRKWLLAMAVMFACVAPDIDILIDPLLGNKPFAHHGYWTHSFLFVLPFALVFAVVMRQVLPWRLGKLALLGGCCYASHVLLDWLNPGRGVAMLWPLVETRFTSPVKLFVGVEYGDLSRWDKHLMTLLNEGLFALIFYGIWRWRCRPRSAARRG